MLRTIAVISTNNASRYLQQLSKHWSHRFAVEFDAERAHISLPLGTTDLLASDDELTVECEVPNGDDMARLQAVVVEHLNRFAFREGELVFDWREQIQDPHR